MQLTERKAKIVDVNSNLSMILIIKLTNEINRIFFHQSHFEWRISCILLNKLIETFFGGNFVSFEIAFVSGRLLLLLLFFIYSLEFSLSLSMFKCLTYFNRYTAIQTHIHTYLCTQADRKSVRQCINELQFRFDIEQFPGPFPSTLSLFCEQ